MARLATLKGRSVPSSRLWHFLFGISAGHPRQKPLSCICGSENPRPEPSWGIMNTAKQKQRCFRHPCCVSCSQTRLLPRFGCPATEPQDFESALISLPLSHDRNKNAFRPSSHFTDSQKLGLGAAGSSPTQRFHTEAAITSRLQNQLQLVNVRVDH